MNTNKNMLEAQIKAAAALMASAQMQLDLISRFGEDTYPLDTVITWEKTFTEGPEAKVYTYIALKARNGYWYVTGMTHRNARTWEELIAWITEQGTVQSMHIVSEWTPIL